MAIVQQQNVTSPERLRQLCKNHRRIADPGVVGAAGPTGQLQPELVQDRVEKRIAQTGRSPKKLRALTCEHRERVLCGLQLALKTAPTQQGKIVPVQLAVVFYRVSPADDVAAEIGVERRLTSDAEKSRFDAMQVQ